MSTEQQLVISPLHDAYDLTKIYIVMKEMKEMGAPKIRAVFDGEKYLAIEGSHRLVAAYSLSILPEIIEVNWDDIINDHDIPDLPEVCTVRDIIDYAGNQTVFDFSKPANYWWNEP